MNPAVHAEISVRRCGGTVDDYYPIYHTAAEARAVKQRLEIQRLRDFNFDEYMEVFQASQQTILELKAFLDPLLEESLFELHERSGNYYVKRWHHLPATLSDDHILQLIDRLEMSYYDINIFEQTQVADAYYIIWIPRLDKPLQAEVDMTYRGGSLEVAPYFFKSKQDAINAFSRLRGKLRRILLEKTYDALSDTPDLLRSFVEGKESFRITDDGIELNYAVIPHEIVGFNALLKVPLFELRPISLDDAKQIPTNPFFAQ